MSAAMVFGASHFIARALTPSETRDVRGCLCIDSLPAARDWCTHVFGILLTTRTYDGCQPR